MSILSGRVIAVTGAASGIGRALAVNLAARGAKLALADRDAMGLAETKAMLGNAHATTTAFDVTDTAALQAFIDAAAAEFGRLDGMINNAGLTVVAPFTQTPKEKFDLVMRVNFDAVVEGCRAAIPHLRKSDQAWLVNISSVFGMMAYPTQSAYNASKFAVRGLTEALHIELAATDPQITVIRVHPGGIKTNVARNAERLAVMPGTPAAADSGVDFAAEFEKAAKTTPEQAAETIVRGMEKRQHRVLIGPDARFIDWMVRLFPVTHARRIGSFLGGGNRKS
ncbi:acetoin dehydrogenase [Polymorphobacter multimanifer]|uniref:NAD(P)-dependent dehydrogenase (Short-subunit alcohol dehydrogenase family) n=1 Tax=Polymorphobacter multimanifer TaxID=1070431 RepID=A0A841LE12_9SPHN|nr:SDR family oxidoreductase [Polymorphobacter multimanifer]MBB6227218.1 NAD(P)-dependent dehydrogenase (short-subunit alcohol dehydrogenase family) [Polymorphobacter multimanifer]GGI81751.1 acetoin dehydrogenase [Polymorphobacter multimanifer]